MGIDPRIEKITEVLTSLRPYLREDGGDIEFVSLSEDGIVEVRFLGECKQCSMSIMTLRAGIERTLMLKVPGLKRIEQASTSANA